MGRPGKAASTRATASSRPGQRNRVTPQTSVAAKARTANIDRPQSHSSVSPSCQPNISGAITTKATDQNGQKARVSRSATSPARVSPTGQARCRI